MPWTSCTAIFFSFSIIRVSSESRSEESSSIFIFCSASKASDSPIFRSVFNSSGSSFSKFSKVVSVNRIACRSDFDSASSSSMGFLRERISCFSFSSVSHTFMLSISLSVSLMLLFDRIIEYFFSNSFSLSIRSVRSDSLTDKRVSDGAYFFFSSSISRAAAIEPKTNARIADI